MEPKQDSLQSQFQDALWRLDVAERALTDARSQLTGLLPQVRNLPAGRGETPAEAAEAAAANATAAPLEPQPLAQPHQPAQAEQAAEQPAPAKRPAPPQGVPQARPQGQPQRPAQAAPKEHKEKEDSLLIKAVAVGGGLITLAGVAFFVVLAVQIGLLGPTMRVILAYVAAAGFGYAAYRYRTTAPPAGATALLATSSYVALLTTFLTTKYMGWWPVSFGAVLLALFYALYLWAGDKLQKFSFSPTTQLWLGLGAGVAAVNYPLYLNKALTNVLILAVPLIALAGSALLKFAHRDAFRAATGIVVVLSFMQVFRSHTDLLRLSFVALAAVLSILLVAVVLYFPTGEVKAPGHMVAGLAAPALLLAYANYHANTTSGIRGYWDSWYEWLPVLWIPVLALATIVALTWSHPRRDYIFQPALGGLGLALADASFDTRLAFPSLVAAVLLAVFLAVFYLVLPRLHPINGVIWAYATFVLVDKLLQGVLSEPEKLLGLHTFIQAILLGIFVAAVYATRRVPASTSRPFLAGVVVLGLVLSMLTVVGVVAYLVGLIDWKAGHTTAFYGAHALVSFAWMFLGARILLRYREHTGLGVLLTVAAMVKLVFFDMAMIDGFFRAMAFFASGVVLLAIAVKRSRTPELADAALPEPGRADQDHGTGEVIAGPQAGNGVRPE